MTTKTLAIVGGPAPRYRVTPGPGGRLVIKGDSTVRGACDLGGVLVDGSVQIPKGKRLVIEDDAEATG